MANNHGLCNTTRVTGWDVDAYKAAGVAQVDMDNGVLVTVNGLTKDADGNITSYTFDVTPATATSTKVWLVRTPEVGTTLEMNLMNDPRYFYNVAGQPVSLYYLNPEVDHIEVDVNCFVQGSSPNEVAGAQYVTIGAGGKYVAATAAPTDGTYFAIDGKHFISIGTEIVPTWVLKVVRN